MNCTAVVGIDRLYDTDHTDHLSDVCNTYGPCRFLGCCTIIEFIKSTGLMVDSVVSLRVFLGRYTYSHVGPNVFYVIDVGVVLLTVVCYC